MTKIVLVIMAACMLNACSAWKDCPTYKDAQSCLQNKCNWDAQTDVCSATSAAS